MLITSILGKSEEITQEQMRALTEVLEDLPYRLPREEAVFRLPDIVERVGNATAGLLNHDAVATSIERVILSPEVVRPHNSRQQKPAHPPQQHPTAAAPQPPAPSRRPRQPARETAAAS